MQKISLVITNYNRFDYLFQSFEKVLNDERIGEVVIVDDCSDPAIFAKIVERTRYMPKVILYRNETNLGCYENKREAVKKANNRYCILFDSDNVIDVDYLDAIYTYTWQANLIFAPVFAKPTFDYWKFQGCKFNRKNVATYAFSKSFDCLMNTMNFFVHRDSFVKVWRKQDNIKGADSIYFNYCWLEALGEIYVVPGLQYFHRTTHDKEHGSNFVQYGKESTPVCKQIERLMSEMR